MKPLIIKKCKKYLGGNDGEIQRLNIFKTVKALNISPPGQTQDRGSRI